MLAEERRRQIAQMLTADKPVSATVLAGIFSVSRQVIVGDIALMRAAGADIIATPRGYKLGMTGGLIYSVACIHDNDGLKKELLAMVDNGCVVLNVVVEHPLYGELTGRLDIASRYDVEQFVEKVKQTRPLSGLTDGLHIHNLRCPDEAAYERVVKALSELGILYRSPEME